MRLIWCKKDGIWTWTFIYPTWREVFLLCEILHIAGYLDWHEIAPLPLQYISSNKKFQAPKVSRNPPPKLVLFIYLVNSKFYIDLSNGSLTPRRFVVEWTQQTVPLVQIINLRIELESNGLSHKLGRVLAHLFVEIRRLRLAYAISWG